MSDPAWIECPSCRSLQSYHAMDHCAYCNAKEPWAGFFTLPVPLLSPEGTGEAPVILTPGNVATLRKYAVDESDYNTIGLCDSHEVLRSTVSRLTRERDEARASLARRNASGHTR